MRTRSVFFVVLIFALVTLPGCPKKQPPPQPPQPPMEQTETAPPTDTVATQTVEPPQAEFPETPEPPEVLSEDIVEVNREARAQGWIRDAMFGYDASTLDDAAQAALTQSATWLREHPEFNLLIEGHCDERGTEQYNLALGERRASVASSYLTTLGIDASRIRTVSYGEEKPFETGSTEEAWAANRRAHLILVKR